HFQKIKRYHISNIGDGISDLFFNRCADQFIPYKMTNLKSLRGIFAILGTCFNNDETIDFESQERLIDYCVDGGLQGLVTLANASEGHLMNDFEKRDLVKFVVEKVNGRVAVVVTINHPSTYCAAEMAKFAQE